MVQHPPEEILSSYVLDPALVFDREALEMHLGSCETCRRAVAGMRAFDELLAEEESWGGTEESAAAGPGLSLRQLAAQNVAEDAEAEELLASLLSGPPAAFVWANLPEKRKYHTGGVVRKLAEAADVVSYSAPLHALNLAETAIAIAGMLSAGKYLETSLAAWRGTAWKQRANALRHLGRFGQALEALDRAERLYRLLPQPELDLASVTYIRATILCDREEYAAAGRLAEESTAAFGHLGQKELYFRSRHLQGAIAFGQRALETAREIYEQIYAYAEAVNDIAWVAREAQALGTCYIELGDLTSATRFLHLGMTHFHGLGITSEEIRCRWGLAIVLQRSGRHRDGVLRLRAVRDEFVSLGATTDAALVALDLMETHLALGEPREVTKMARGVVALLADAGMLTGALTAAAYLKEAAALGRVTPQLLTHVRRYLRNVELQPDLAFAPPSAGQL